MAVTDGRRRNAVSARLNRQILIFKRKTITSREQEGGRAKTQEGGDKGGQYFCLKMGTCTTSEAQLAANSIVACAKAREKARLQKLEEDAARVIADQKSRDKAQIQQMADACVGKNVERIKAAINDWMKPENQTRHASFEDAAAATHLCLIELPVPWERIYETGFCMSVLNRLQNHKYELDIKIELLGSQRSYVAMVYHGHCACCNCGCFF
jgi:hypothetical protein